MQFSRIVRCLPMRRASLVGLGLIVFASMLGTEGCLTYKLTSLYVEPNGGACVPPGGTAQYTAYGTYTEGGHTNETKDLTDAVTWSTDLPELATVNSTGLALAATNSIGLTDVKASAEGEFGLIWASAPLTVSESCVSGSGAVRTLSAIRILPGDETLRSVGDTSQVVAVGRYSGQPVSENLTSKVTWASSDTRVATVTAGGLVTAAGAGDATITATRTSAVGTVVTATEKIHVGGGSALR
jgi:trimeric autotransporter adhesin